ncbi:MAG: DnaJ domain-containing protein [Fusobacteriota bacterium]
MATYDDYLKAIHILDLPMKFNLIELKSKYKNMIKKKHPDKNDNKYADLERIKSAYELLKSYIENYKFNFKKNDFKFLTEDIFEEKLRNEWEV